MQQRTAQRRVAETGKSYVGRVLVLAGVMGCFGVISGVQAQGSKFGTYEGTVQVQGAEIGKLTQHRYRYTVKIKMPLTDRSSSSAMAEVGDIDKPSATALIQQWDTFQTGSSPESDGKISTVTCTLAAPVEVPMNAQGVLNVNYSAKTHSMFIGLAGMKEVPMNCTHSRSGAHKRNTSVGGAFGTNLPQAIPWTELPYTDAGRLTAKHKLVVKPGHEQNQEWDLRLQK